MAYEYEVIVLDKAREFIASLPKKLEEKAYRTVNLLRQHGSLLLSPDSITIKSVKGLRELRVKQGSNICRLFYFHEKGRTYIVMSGYLKKEQKTSSREIMKAKKIMDKMKGEINGKV